MKDKLIWPVFWAMVAVFIAEIAVVLADVAIRYAMFIGMGLFLALGITLIIITIKTKITGKLKAFLILTGSSAVGFPVFAVLHNLVYGLLILWFGEDFWGATGDEPVFFIIAVIVCPAGFVVGAVSTIVLAVKNKLKTAPTGTS